MSARKQGDRPGQRGGSTDGNRRNAATAKQLKDAHAADPDEINIAIAELDAQKAFGDRQQGRP